MDSYIQTYSVIAITLAAGTNISTTLVSLPALLSAPRSTLAKQWKVLFDHGVTPMIALTTTSGVGFATLAYRVSQAPLAAVNPLQRNLYIAAAITALGLGPFTKLLMWGNIEMLEERARTAGEGKADADDTHALVKTWGRYNFWRGMMLLGSAGLGMWATVN